MSNGGGYDPKAVEADIYAFWERGDEEHPQGFFHAQADPQRQPFTVVIPPPNVTGALHLGHALNNTLQDIIVRRKRMQGFNACWLPGTDHAGIATQAVVEKRLKEEQGLSRHEIGRDGLVKKIWEWKEEYNTRILNQLRKMGCSCDWQRTRFTLDEQCAKAVYETFFRLFKDGLIYRGLRLVNWDTQLQTAVADDEVYHETVRGSLWHIRYPIEGSGNEYVVVATTRPETMLADTAVAVHPEDERYTHRIGRQVILPLMNRPIPIVADGMLVKREFGTGCVKVTPGHDPNDYACWQRKQGQPDEIGIIDLLTPDGKIRPDFGAYSGLKKEEARKRVVADLEALGLLEKVEPYETEIGHSDRSKTPIEPLRSEQWFVRMEPRAEDLAAAAREGRTLPRLAELAMDAVRDGRVRFFPERYAKTYLDWLGEKRDWCISRQLWWGHRIPVWTREARADDELRDLMRQVDFAFGTNWGPEVAGVWRQQERAGDGRFLLRCCVANPSRDQKAREILENLGFAQDPDVLDTWFSSALWPHSTFGWPEDPNPPREWGGSAASDSKTPTRVVGSDGHADLDYFYPTTLLSTAREIITLWVARMVLTGLYNLGRVPFQQVYIHAVIQDGQGRPMKKSLGNGVDPVDIIDAYGADALRFTLAQLAGETQDIRIPVKPTTLPDGRTINTSERFELGRNFANKLYQAATGFVLPNLAGPGSSSDGRPLTRDDLAIEDRWILSRLAATVEEVDRRLERYQFNEYANAVYSFFWSDFCDWYVEFVKPRLYGKDTQGSTVMHQDASAQVARRVLAWVLDQSLRLLHPAMPFVTEHLWAKLNVVAPIRGINILHSLGEGSDSAGSLVRDSHLAPPIAGIRSRHPRDENPAVAAAREDSRIRGRQNPELRIPRALIVAAWPTTDEWPREPDVEREIAPLQDVIRALREIRTSLNAIRSQASQPALKALPRAAIRCDRATADKLEARHAVLQRLGSVEAVSISPDIRKPPHSMSRILAGTEVYVPIAGLADIDIERRRLAKEADETRAAIQRLETKLANEGFVAKAKPEVVEAERTRLADLRQKLATIKRNLAELAE